MICSTFPNFTINNQRHEADQPRAFVIQHSFYAATDISVFKALMRRARYGEK
jgi:hypothetical protein